MKGGAHEGFYGCHFVQKLTPNFQIYSAKSGNCGFFAQSYGMFWNYVTWIIQEPLYASKTEKEIMNFDDLCFLSGSFPFSDAKLETLRVMKKE